MTPTLASLQAGPIEFSSPVYLWLLPILGVLALWIGRKNLSGLGSASRVTAVVIRLLVIALLVAALAEPRWRDESEDVAVTAVLDVSRSVPTSSQEIAERWLADAAEEHKRQNDSFGVISVAEDALVHALPNRGTTEVHKGDVGETTATNLAEGIGLALAVKPKSAALRLVLLSDGNETEGSLLQMAQEAKAKGVPIDVVPYTYNFEREVMTEQIIVPETARMNETVNARVVLNAKAPARGMLTITLNDEPIDLDPDSNLLGVIVELDRGPNVLSAPVTLPEAGPQQWQAFFEALPDENGIITDTISENNTAMATTFVSGEGKVLIVSESPIEHAELQRALTESRIATEVVTKDEFPRSLTQLNGYDAIILVNQPNWNFNLQQQDDLIQYVRDSGGGLIMTGGPDAYGAGGWIGSPLAEILPVRLDPPQKRQTIRGALVLVMHSIEMPQGVHYGKQVANLAIDALSRLDLAGIVEYSGFGGGAEWVHPLSELGDKSAIRRAVSNLRFGDMPSFDPSLNLALTALQNADAGAKHVIIVSDGDPSLSRRIVQQFAKSGITISTVGVFPHSPRDFDSLRYMAEATRGTFYSITTQAQLAQLPEIIVRETQTVSRPLIWEKGVLVPTMTGMPSEPMRGIRAVPPITGYIVTGPREGFAVTTMLGEEGDPIMAHWQHGLGRVVCFTPDTSSRWANNWIAWDGFKQFWEQHVRWAMRPGGDANVRVTTQSEGETTRVIVEMTDQSGTRLDFARFTGRIASPDGEGLDVDLVQMGPGRYEGQFNSADPGSYLIGLRYAAPNPDGGNPYEGSVQASVERPFADEFRALKDNSSLLAQIAEMTGGRVVTELNDRETANFWRRDGVTMPVATRPIWLELAFIGLVLFLMDVAVRRVRIDIPLMGRQLVGALSTSQKAAGEGLGALQEARAKARSGRTAAGSTGRRAVKFEASEQELAKGPSSPVTGERPAAKIERPRPAEPKDDDAEEGISRLMRAKKRARDEFNEDNE